MGSSIGGLVGGIFGANSAPSAPNVNVYQPTGTANVDQELQSLLSGNFSNVGANNPFTQYSPEFANLYSQIYSNPYQAGAQTSANTAGAGYTAAGTAALNNSTALSGALSPALTSAQQFLTTAFDPQGALQAQQLQGTTDAANVANSAYGLTGQQAAGNLNQATTNFGIDWQDNELSRQLQGLQGYDQTLGAVGTAGTATQNLGTGGAGAIAEGGTVPYQQSVYGTTNQSTALQQYIQSLLGPSTSDQSTITDLGNYLGQGIDASTAGQAASSQDYLNQLLGSQLGSQEGGGLGAGLGSAGLGSAAFSFLGL